MVSPEASVRMYAYRFASGDQPKAPIAVPSLASWNFLVCSPFGLMSQISRSPILPLFVPNETKEPSGEMAQATACSRSFVGAPPSTETAQIPVLTELHSFHSSTEGWILTRNLVLS